MPNVYYLNWVNSEGKLEPWRVTLGVWNHEHPPQNTHTPTSVPFPPGHPLTLP